MSAAGRSITLRVVHDGAQPGAPVGDAVLFGLQDRSGGVHPPTATVAGQHRFVFAAEVKQGASGPTLAGPFCHGPPAARFVYLSWRRASGGAAPWAWRIKLPLAHIEPAVLLAAQQPDRCLHADATGRKPHASAPVVWSAAPLLA